MESRVWNNKERRLVSQTRSTQQRQKAFYEFYLSTGLNFFRPSSEEESTEPTSLHLVRFSWRMEGRERGGQKEDWMIAFQEWEIRLVRAWLSFGNEISNMKIVYKRTSFPSIKFTRPGFAVTDRPGFDRRDGKSVRSSVTSARSKMYMYIYILCFVIGKFFFVFYRWIFFLSYNLDDSIHR